MTGQPYILRAYIPATVNGSSTAVLLQKMNAYYYYELAENERFRIEWNRSFKGTDCVCRADAPKIEVKEMT